MQVRMETGDGLYNEIDRRSVEVDNLPPRPDMVILDGSVVTDYEFLMKRGRFFPRSKRGGSNDGDVGATGVIVSLFEDGQRRYETAMPKISVSEKPHSASIGTPRSRVPRTYQ